MPFSELERLGFLRKFLRMNFTREAELQRIVQLAADTCNCPTGLITLLYGEQQFFLVSAGTPLGHTDGKFAFCSQIVLGDEVMIINDVEFDPRFSQNPLVTGEPYIRFYAGAPLITSDGNRLGSLCLIDIQPHELTITQQEMFILLRDYSVMILEFEISIDILKEQHLRSKSSETKVRALFESSKTCHVFISPDLEVLHFNKAVSDFIKRNSGQLITAGENITRYMHQGYIEKFKTNFLMAMQGTSICFDIKLAYQEREIWWDISYQPVYGTDGRIIGVSHNATDISDRKNHELRIVEQNNALKEVARIQSHEFRRPVASILGIVNLMESMPDTDMREMISMLGTLAKELDHRVHLVMETVNKNQDSAD